MDATEVNPPGIISLLRKAAMTGFGVLHNRTELFLVELQEEKNRVLELAIWIGLALFLGFMFMVVLTATIIFLFSPERRVYAAGAFAFLYFVGMVLALLNLKALVKRVSLPFSDSIEEFKKDRKWLDSLK